MRRTLRARRGDVMHYTGPQCKTDERRLGGQNRLPARDYGGQEGRLGERPPSLRPSRQFPRLSLRRLERVKGIEPSSSAWKAVALPLSYTRINAATYRKLV